MIFESNHQNDVRTFISFASEQFSFSIKVMLWILIFLIKVLETAEYGKTDRSSTAGGSGFKAVRRRAKRFGGKRNMERRIRVLQ